MLSKLEETIIGSLLNFLLTIIFLGGFDVIRRSLIDPITLHQIARYDTIFLKEGLESWITITNCRKFQELEAIERILAHAKKLNVIEFISPPKRHDHDTFIEIPESYYENKQ